MESGSSCSDCLVKCSRRHASCSRSFYIVAHFPAIASSLKIPKRFVHRMTKDSVLVDGPYDSLLWRFAVSRDSNSLTLGWRDFVDMVSLSEGEVLMFTEIGDSRLAVQVFELDGCLKKSAPPRPRLCSSNKNIALPDLKSLPAPPTVTEPKKKRTPLQTEKKRKKRTPLAAEKAKKRLPSGPATPKLEVIPYVKKRAWSSAGVAEKRPLCHLSRSLDVCRYDRKKGNNYLDKNGRPFFAVQLRRSAVTHCCRVNMPKEFAECWLPKTIPGPEIKLLFPRSEKIFKVNYRGYKQFRGFTWKECVLEQGLDEGDICEFTMINKDPYVFKVNVKVPPRKLSYKSSEDGSGTDSESLVLHNENDACGSEEKVNSEVSKALVLHGENDDGEEKVNSEVSKSLVLHGENVDCKVNVNSKVPSSVAMDDENNACKEKVNSEVSKSLVLHDGNNDCKEKVNGEFPKSVILHDENDTCEGKANNEVPESPVHVENNTCEQEINSEVTESLVLHDENDASGSEEKVNIEVSGTFVLDDENYAFGSKEKPNSEVSNTLVSHYVNDAFGSEEKVASEVSKRLGSHEVTDACGSKEEFHYDFSETGLYETNLMITLNPSQENGEMDTSQMLFPLSNRL